MGKGWRDPRKPNAFQYSVKLGESQNVIVNQLLSKLCRFLPAGAGLRIGILLFSANEFIVEFRTQINICAYIFKVNGLISDTGLDL